jgi:hypothetical protein
VALFRAAVQTWPEVAERAALRGGTDGLPRGGGARHGAVLALRHRHAARAPERARLNDYKTRFVPDGVKNTTAVPPCRRAAVPP